MSDVRAERGFALTLLEHEIVRTFLWNSKKERGHVVFPDFHKFFHI